MTSESENCGLTSLLPMSCRGRAVAFAKSLHSRLTSLNTESDSADETSWLTNSESNIATTQPRHVLDFSPLESPGSPEEDLDELQKLINGDGLSDVGGSCKCSAKIFKTNSDSDSDVYYDVDNDSDLEKRLVNGSGKNHDCNRSANGQTEVPLTNNHVTNGTSSPTAQHAEQKVNKTASDSGVPKTGADDHPQAGCDKAEETETSTQEEFFSTTSDLSSPSLSKESSTLSLRDEDCSEAKSNGGTKDADREVYVSHLDVDRSCTVEITEDVEKDDEEKSPVRRCSSLKSGKTPPGTPGTPGNKKIVRFADAMGLDLADVRTFLDEIPKVPISAFVDLKVEPGDQPNGCGMNPAYHGIKADKILVPFFAQPGSLPNFLDRVRDHQVCLENALVDDPFLFSIKGIIRVRNLDFHKSAYVRYTLNSWKTFADVQATYLENSCDGFSDKFAFVVYAHTLSEGQSLEFACRFQCKGCQYWDNNFGKNYIFQCLPNNNVSPVAPITSSDDWGASFYY